MHKFFKSLTIIAIAALPFNSGLAASPFILDEERGVMTMAPVLEEVTPGVVNIAVRTKVAMQRHPLFNDPFFRRFYGVPEEPPVRESTSAGSGVIIDAAKGLVMTNHHVIDNASSITVTLKDRRRFEAKLIGSDPGTDIALLEIEADNLTAVSMGNSEQVEVGDLVIAIGNPFGIGQTVTSGIVSALGRSGLGIEGYEDFIQTDASINPGNSGGALINSKGELVGVNTAIIGPGGGNVGIGFAVPANMAAKVMDQLLEYGEVRRGRIGVAIQDLTPDIAQAMGLAQQSGAIISSVEPGYPAAEKLQAGDIVISLNGSQIDGSSDLRNQVGLVPPGEELELIILRDREEKAITLEVGALEPEKLSGDRTVPELAGALFKKIPEEDARAKEIPGVLVAEVQQGSPAWHGGLRPNDVIVEVNRNRVMGLEEFNKALKQANTVIALRIVRQGRDFFTVIQR